jgi:class 3 adenylate cyclase
MDNLPLQLAERLHALTYSEHSVAYLQVDGNLNLVGAGGHLKQYGLDAVRFGKPAVEQAFFLEGLLPLDASPYYVPLVELANGRAADLHFHADTDTVWVLLLDVTADRDAARRVQQKAYEMTLLEEKEKLLNRRLEAANAALLEAQHELLRLNQQLEQRVADQVGEIERMSKLRRFLPPQVADLIVASGTEKQLESHRREITALFCDLRGFTGFSESADPEDVMALLHEYHAAIGEIIIKFRATLERFTGDGVMIVFNDPVPVENPVLQAVLMALDMRTALSAVVEKWRWLGHDLGFGIGIAHGFATLGIIGFEGRHDYSAIGTVCNVASRLCDEAKPGQILISPRVLMAIEKAVTVEPVGEFTLKGIRRPVMTYNVLLPSKPN